MCGGHMDFLCVFLVCVVVVARCCHRRDVAAELRMLSWFMLCECGRVKNVCVYVNLRLNDCAWHLCEKYE